ncbi:hypothetical protein SAMN04490189_4784 [Pseudomonas koreensis]|uniref:hypothetical protein n=1 Tax=Pseudomonas koreensis TaxID=198620 RepID=UPI00087A8E84|nr:hypothetical protein [Pseudomonas koreensis]KAB0513402.1 hypothetical protein F7R05_15285 [Pseudomonas koreensis]NNA63657.1 hypothetical protein [Pseudomonas koreensis]GGK39484.1 hypothetical protein GCM10009103_38250 [Pseudomonas koreensis]SDE23918.1 hypothetical protein SAMN04490189_4784 [Pseudomonas koreensis]
MRTFYIYDPGIKLCEQPEFAPSPDFVSFTIISASLQDIWSTWIKISRSLSLEWPTTIKWRTIGYSLENQKIQEIRLRKDIESTLGANGILKKNAETKIYSYLNPTDTHENRFKPDELTQYRNTFLILKKNTPDLLLLLEQLSKDDKAVTSRSILKFMNFDRETLIARFLESDTHSTLQLITPAENLKKITPIFENLEIRKVTHTEIPEIINNL